MQDRVAHLVPARPLVVVAQYLDLRLLEGAVRGAVVGPGLAEEEPAPLRRDDADVRVVATERGRFFLGKARTYDGAAYGAFEQAQIEVLSDDDEWARWNKVGDPVLHVDLREWADLLLIAPLGANTLAKLANGLCDDLLSCTARAWDLDKPMVVAPAMNTAMWSHPMTAHHLAALRGVYDAAVVAPVSKALACGDVGIGALADVDDVAAAARAALGL